MSTGTSGRGPWSQCGTGREPHRGAGIPGACRIARDGPSRTASRIWNTGGMPSALTGRMSPALVRALFRESGTSPIPVHNIGRIALQLMVQEGPANRESCCVYLDWVDGRRPRSQTLESSTI